MQVTQTHLEFNLAEEFYETFTSLEITELHGFERLGPAKEKDDILDTNIGCYVLINGERKDFDFDGHAHLPHYLPVMTMIVKVNKVVCTIDPSEALGLLANPGDVERFIRSTVKYWVDRAMPTIMDM